MVHRFDECFSFSFSFSLLLTVTLTSQSEFDARKKVNFIPLLHCWPCTLLRLTTHSSYKISTLFLLNLIAEACKYRAVFHNYSPHGCTILINRSNLALRVKGMVDQQVSNRQHCFLTKFCFNLSSNWKLTMIRMLSLTV